MRDERMRELAILGLEAERSRIEEELASLRGVVEPTKKRLGRPPAAAKAPVETEGKQTDGRKTRKKRKMSAAKKQALSENMKRIWAERRKGTR